MLDPVSVTNPELVSQWHPSKNGDLSPDDVTAGSSQRIWWVCPVDGYEWAAVVGSRARRGAGCPVCSGTKTVDGFNDLSTKYPKVAAQWNYARNGDIPKNLSGGSAEKYWWTCPKGHEWNAIVRNRAHLNSGCPVCAGVKVLVGVNDFASQYPHLAKQWHPTKNFLNPDQIVPGSERNIWWMCEHGHEWQAQPAARIVRAAGQCPVCANQLIIPGINDIFTTHPHAKKEWSKRNTINPKTIPAGHSKKVWWKCAKKHEWEATPGARFVTRNEGCPVCSLNKRDVGVNDLATTHPDLAKELVDVDPTTIGAGSGNQKWKCAIDGYVWTTSVHGRTSKGYGCPLCANKVVVEGVNDLATTHPHVAEQWHPDNKKKPTEVVAGSAYYAKWLCPLDGREWETSVSNRTYAQSMCPTCSSRTVSSKGEQDLADEIEKMLKPLNVSIKRNVWGLVKGFRSEADIYIPSLNTAVEYNGTYYHSSAHYDKDRHTIKVRKFSDSGIRIIQIWEDDWQSKRDAVLEFLKTELGCRKEYTRRVKLVTVDEQESAAFLDANHPLGHVPGTSHYGLRKYGQELIAVMSVSSDGDTHTLVRHAVSENITDGFGKLLAFVEDDLRAKGTTHLYVDVDLETDIVSRYLDLGFQMDSDLPADFAYLISGTSDRIRKQSLDVDAFKSHPKLTYQDRMTVPELAELNGLLRCYNSGVARLVKKL